MSNQNRFLLPHQPGAGAGLSSSSTSAASLDSSSNAINNNQENEFQLSVDTDFDSYWEEEARNPHRNRIRIGRQYQATVPQLLKAGEKDARNLEKLETLSFCPKKSAKVSNAELDHYFTVAKSLNLFASLVETRSLLGRDVTIADLNRIRHKEGLSLASVIQPSRQAAIVANSNFMSPQLLQQASNNSVTVVSSGDQKSPIQTNQDIAMSSSASSSDVGAATSTSQQETTTQETFNLPLMRALSHFISLHHPCHHDNDCKKLLKDIPLEDDTESVVSIKAGNLRGQGSLSSAQSPAKEFKTSRSRASTKLQTAASIKNEDSETKDNSTTAGEQQEQTPSDTTNSQNAPYDDWTREDVKLFSQAIEVCGKNFGSIKKEFLPSKSVKSIVEYYYIGSREGGSDSKKKSSQNVEASSDACNSSEKTLANNNGGGGNGGGLSPCGKNTHNTHLSDLSNATGRSNNNGSTSDFTKTLPDAADDKQAAHTNNSKSHHSSPRQAKIENSSNKSKASKNIDARMSVYNFDDEIKEENSPVARLDNPCPGAEVKPLKAKPIMPNAPTGSEGNNSNVGSLKFFMDGQLVLKLNACQEQQKCHWVQSGDKMPQPNQRQKRYSKRANDRSTDLTSQNGSHSNSILSSNNDDSNLSADEDSKESANSFTNVATVRQKSFSASPSPKRSRSKTEPVASLSPNLPQQINSPIDYNRLAVTNLKERIDNNLTTSNNNNNVNNNNLIPNQAPPPMLNPDWLQANSFAMAAALLGGLPFPQVTTNNVVTNQMQNPASASVVNMASRPMDLSVEHPPPKPMPPASKSNSRSKSKQKNS